MNRRLRTDVPVDPSSLMPTIPDYNIISDREHTYKQNMKTNYDQGHNARKLPEVVPSDNVYIRDLNRTGIVTQTLSDNSVQVLTDSSEVRRNRRAVIPLPDNQNTDNHISNTP